MKRKEKKRKEKEKVSVLRAIKRIYYTVGRAGLIV
jgi:hypothetical protein